MAIETREQAYKILGIRLGELSSLSVEQRLSLYKKRHRALSLRYHPDRNPGSDDTNQFVMIQEAYEYLVKPIEEERSEREFKEYFPSSHAVMDFPLEAVDLRLEMMIKEELQEILMRFSRLETQDQKLAFAERYRDFVAIAGHLVQHSHELSDSRFNQFFYLYSHYTPKLAQFWRTNMLELFGEEMLDDFSYREALGTGRLYPVLATRKLLNPVKLLAAIIMSLLALIKASYYQLQISIGHQVQHLINAMRVGVGKDNIGRVLLAAIMLVTAVSVPVLAGYYCFSAFVVVACVPLLDKLCRWISCPTNTLIRPLLTSLGLQDSLGRYMPFVVPLLLIGSAVGIAFALSTLPVVTLPVVELLLTASIVASQLYVAYSLLKLVYLCFQKSVAFGVLQLGIVAFSIGLGILFPVQPDLGALKTLGELALMNISTAVLFHAILGIVGQGAEYLNSIIEKYPMPTKAIPENFKAVINDAVNYSTYSHELFNTQEDANPLAQNERSFWQQSQSFFGFCNAKSLHCVDEAPDFSERAEAPLLLMHAVN